MEEAIPFVNAFNELVGSRQIGFKKYLIPYGEIIKWLDENNKYGDIRDTYLELIQYIDSTELVLCESKAEQNRSQNKKR